MTEPGTVNGGHRAVIFDLDGTLVDSSHDIARALNRMLAERGLGRVTAAQVEPLLGEGAARLVAGVHALLGSAVADREIAADTARYLACYAEEPVRESTLYHDAAQALAALAARRIPLGVCTNKDHDLAVRVLDELGVGDHFGCVVGGDDLPVRKPDPEHLWATVRGLEVTPEAVLFVGDSAIDAECAERAGVPCLLVEWALADRQEQRLRRFMDLVPRTRDESLATTTTEDQP